MKEQPKTVWIENSELKAVIVTSDNPCGIAAYAAEEIVDHVKLATGCNSPLTKRV